MGGSKTDGKMLGNHLDKNRHVTETGWTVTANYECVGMCGREKRPGQEIKRQAGVCEVV